MMHNKIFVDTEKVFTVSQSKLLIDIDMGNKEGKIIKALRLYPKDLVDMKLIKYNICYES